MFIGKLLLGAVFDLLPCLDKIMDGLLWSGIVDEWNGPDSALDTPGGSASLQVSVFWSGSSCLWAKHRGRSAGCWGNSLCWRIFCLSFPNFKNCSHYCPSGLFPRVSLWEQITFCTFKSSCWYSMLDWHTEFFFTTSILSWVLRSVMRDSPGSRGSLVGAALGAAWKQKEGEAEIHLWEAKRAAVIARTVLVSQHWICCLSRALSQSLGGSEPSRAVGRSGNAAGNVPSGMFSRKIFPLVQCCRMWVLDPRCSSQKPPN